MSRVLIQTGRCLRSSSWTRMTSAPGRNMNNNTSSYASPLLRSVSTVTLSTSSNHHVLQRQPQPQRQLQQLKLHPNLQQFQQVSSFHSSSPSLTNASKHYPNVTFSSSKLTELFDRIVYLDMVEIHLLTELLNQKMGITLTDAERANMAAGGTGGGGGAGAAGGAEDAPAEEEKTAFDLKLTGFDKKAKIKVIKEVRAMSGLGLKEAKELVEGAPKVVKKDMKKEEAEELKAKLEAVGATVELA